MRSSNVASCVSTGLQLCSLCKTPDFHAQLTLFCPVQEFDRGFAPRGFCPVLAGLAVYEPERPAAFGVSGSLPRGMLGQAPVEII
jgi:hypothetical protein